MCNSSIFFEFTSLSTANSFLTSSAASVLSLFVSPVDKLRRTSSPSLEVNPDLRGTRTICSSPFLYPPDWL